MSGIEVAGIVLALLPLFISAWEHYERGLDPVTAFWSWERQLPVQIDKLRTQQCLFECNLDLLIAPIVSPAEREALNDKDFNEIWKDEGIHSKIKQRLGRALGPFESSLRQFERTCRSIADCLDLGVGETSVTQDSLESLLAQKKSAAQRGSAKECLIKFQAKRRLKFGWSQKRIKRLLKELEACDGILDKLLDRVSRMDPYQPRLRQPTSSNLQQIHAQACRLLRTLAKTWSCAAHTSHLAAIQLERRLATNSEGRNLALSKDCTVFRFAFTASEGCAVHPHRAHFHEIEVLVSEKTAMGTIGSNVVQHATASHADIDAASLQVVRNICTALDQAVADRCVGPLFESENQCLRGSFPGKLEGLSGDADLVKLEDLLHLGRRGKTYRGLDKPQRLTLAATVMSSILQLHSTCFSLDWSKRAISFMRSKQDHLDLDRPLLMRVFRKADAAAGDIQSTQQSALALLSLGALMLELHSGETLEERLKLETSPFSSEDAPTVTLAVCQKWLEEEWRNLSRSWKQAINFLLMSYVDFHTDLADESFRKKVHDAVLLPLEEDARDFIGSSFDLHA